MARIVAQVVHDSLGKEAALGVIGRAYLVAGIVAALGGVAVTALSGSFMWMIAGMVFLVVGIAVHVLFGALGELITLLKRLCGLPTSLPVSGTAAATIHLCSACGAMVYETSDRCPRCKEIFEREEHRHAGSIQ